ncbi:MAG: hypothetical protein ACQETP_07625 [Bacteroidota bacterium]
MTYPLSLTNTTTQRVRTTALRAAAVWVSMLVLAMMATVVPSYAQTPDIERSDARPVHVVIAPVYEQVDDGSTSLRSWSTRTQLTVPIRERTMVQGSIQYGHTTGDSFTSVHGPTDLKLRVQHTVPVRQGRIVAGLDANLPTGTDELTADELRTTIQTSQQPYGFRVPTFGQGWSVAPTVTWAVPVSEQAAIGVGLSGRYEGGYRPLANSATDYVPGNEVEVQLGLDYRLSEASTVALDGTGAYITPDTENGDTRFDVRYTASVRAQYLWQHDEQVVRAQVRYENWPESRFRPILLSEDGVDTGSEQTQRVLPSIWSGAVGYTRTLTDRVQLGLRTDIQHFTSTNRFDAATLGRLLVAPRVQWDPVTMGVHGAYTLGSFTGFETGLRTTFQF